MPSSNKLHPTFSLRTTNNCLWVPTRTQLFLNFIRKQLSFRLALHTKTSWSSNLAFETTFLKKLKYQRTPPKSYTTQEAPSEEEPDEDRGRNHIDKHRWRSDSAGRKAKEVWEDGEGLGALRGFEVT